MVIVIKGPGQKIYSMEKVNRNIKTEIFLKGSLCTEANSDKEFTNSAMEASIKATFTMVIATDTVG